MDATGGSGAHAERVDVRSRGQGSVADQLARLRTEPVRTRWLDDALGGPARWAQRVRVDPGARGVAALAALGVLVAVVAGMMVLRDRPQAHAVPRLPPPEPVTSSAGSATTTTAALEMVVSVVGLVVHPGLVRLAPQARVVDAVAAAGGAVPGADLVSLNMARPIADGDQIVVGSATATKPVADEPSSVQGPTTPTGKGAPTRPAGKINLNTATEQELDALPGVGPTTAAEIVTWRRGHGRFSDVNQLGEIPGIGPAKLARLRALVTL